MSTEATRRELKLSSIFYVMDENQDTLLTHIKNVAHDCGLGNVRECYALSLNNQPRTIRYNATNPQDIIFLDKLKDHFIEIGYLDPYHPASFISYEI